MRTGGSAHAVATPPPSRYSAILMPPRRRAASNASRTTLVLGVLAGVAVLLFGVGEAWRWSRSDRGRVLAARYLHWGDRAQVVRVMSQRIRAGLESAKVPAEAVEEQARTATDGPALVWRVALPPAGAPLQVNYAITHMVEGVGAEVLSARERRGEAGELDVVMRIGLPGRPTHEVVLHRPGRGPAAEARSGDAQDEAQPAPRIALVLTGLSQEVALLEPLLARGAPLALAVPAAGPARRPLLQLAHRHAAEVVLQIPMEPENYPHANPGPGTLRVDMPKGKVEQDVRRFITGVERVAAVSNLMGGFAAQDEPFMRAFYDGLKREGQMFLQVSPPSRSVCRVLASEMGVEYDEPDAMLEAPGGDDARARAAAKKALDAAWTDALERAARHGQALVLVRLSPASAAWLTALLADTEAGVQWATASSVLRRPAAL